MDLGFCAYGQKGGTIPRDLELLRELATELVSSLQYMICEPIIITVGALIKYHAASINCILKIYSD